VIIPLSNALESGRIYKNATHAMNRMNIALKTPPCLPELLTSHDLINLQVSQPISSLWSSLVFTLHITTFQGRPSNTTTTTTYTSKLSLTHFLTFFLNPAGSSLHCLAASTFAALSSFGLESMLITERRMVAGVWTGDQRSEADS
jgi:hypothetical protein